MKRRYTKKHVEVEAEQFRVEEKPWPSGVYPSGCGDFLLGEGDDAELVEDGDWIVEGEDRPLGELDFNDLYRPATDDGEHATAIESVRACLDDGHTALDAWKVEALLAAYDARATDDGEGWVAVEDRLPEDGRRVLAVWGDRYGTHRSVVSHLAARTEEADGDYGGDDEWLDYDAEADTYWLPEGWYEAPIETEEWRNIDNVTHWRDLPALPKEDSDG